MHLDTSCEYYTQSGVQSNCTPNHVTVADILTGRTIHCKSLDELYVKENEIKDKISKYCNYIEGMASLGNEQRIDLSRG
jgi:hypothetical protein